jgi:hypothetical protein
METINGVKNELQQVPEWYLQRIGNFSGSQFYRLMTEPKLKADKEAGNLSDGAMTYVYECVAEKITGKRAKEEFSSKYTDHGNEHEPIAKQIYETVWKCKVVDSDYIAFNDACGGSPDGLVGDDGLIEIKCPYTITSHLEHKLKDLSTKPEYYWQCIGYLLITGRKWIDFISYHPEYPGKHQIVKKRINRSDVLPEIKRLEDKLTKAIEQRNLILNSI